MSGAKTLVGAAFVILFGSVLLAYYVNTQALPWNSSLILIVGALGFIAFMAVGTQLILFDTSWVTRRFREMQPSEPDDNTIVRVVKTDAMKGEYFVYAGLNDTVRKAVDNDWPFKGNLRKKEWHVVDEQGNDVTDQPYIDEEGTLRVVFD